jgi:hypothetical protein
MSKKKLIGAIMTSLGAAFTAIQLALGPKAGRGIGDNYVEFNAPAIGIGILIIAFGLFLYFGNFKKKREP